MLEANHNTAKEIFHLLKIPHPEYIIKTDAVAVLTFTNLLQTCIFLDTYHSKSITPFPKIEGTLSSAGKFRCILTKDSYNLLCNKLRLGADAFNKLPQNTQWQSMELKCRAAPVITLF